MNSISALLLVFLLRPTQSLVINLPGVTGPTYTCPGDGTFPDLQSGCEEYYVCRAGRVGVIHQVLKQLHFTNTFTELEVHLQPWHGV